MERRIAQKFRSGIAPAGPHEPDCEVGLVARDIREVPRGFKPHLDLGIKLGKGAEPRDQPLRCE